MSKIPDVIKRQIIKKPDNKMRFYELKFVLFNKV